MTRSNAFPYMRQITITNDFSAWRNAARALLEADVPPGEVFWAETGLDQATLPGLAQPAYATEFIAGATAPLLVPKAFVDLAKIVACHRDPERWPLLYRVAYRIARGSEHALLNIESDVDVRQLQVYEKAVRFDAHKMKAFVRFRRIIDPFDDGEHYIAWHKPEHCVLRDTAPFFSRRFGSMRWSILTPDLSAYWSPEKSELTFGPGVPRSDAPQGDDLEDLWKTYYANIFNPARVKIKAMKKEMPQRYWSTMPETALIPDLLAEAPRRTEDMMAKAKAMAAKDREDFPTAAAYLPDRLSLTQLREASSTCKGCPLYKNATQTVFGEGPASASVVFVGEQPGDNEDLEGKPFVGPAGQMLDDGLEAAGIDRGDVYVTNAVKHFKWEPRGKRRIHSKPSSREIDACVPWLKSELATVQPKLVVCLGATAAQALLGKQFRVTKSRGEVLTGTQWAPAVVATVHPSSILRAPDDAARKQAYHDFVVDLKIVRKEMDRITEDEASASGHRHGNEVNAARAARKQFLTEGTNRPLGASIVEPR